MPGQSDDDVDETLLEQKDLNGRPKLTIERSVFSQKKFDEDFIPGSRPSRTFKQVVGKQLSKFQCNRPCLKEFLYTVFPFIGILKNYKIREDLLGDVVSGLTVGIMHIPQGMAYGMLTTLPPVYGLYTSFFPVLVYFFLGSSKHISIGTFAVACLMVGSSVSKGYHQETESMPPSPDIAPPGNDTINGTVVITSVTDHEAMSDMELQIRLQYAMSVSFMTGLIQFLMGLFRLGFVTVYLSDPLISGFTTGAACHVFTSQIKHVFGVKTARYSGAFKLIYTYRDFFMHIPDTNSITLITSILCIALLYSVGRFINQNPRLKPKMFMPVPIELIVVVLGTLISYLVKLNENHKVVIVDDIPTGIPPPTMPFSKIQYVISDAIALAIVIFAISISMGKLLAKKHDYEVNANQDLIAFGVSTMASSFFSSTAASASLSRSLVQERVGGRTQVAGLVSCVLLLVVLLAIGPYFRTLPNCVLASIIIVALKGMFLQVLDLRKLWSVSLIDFFVWIVAFLATVLLDVDLGLGVAVIFNILSVVCRNQKPNSCLLGQMPGTDIYRDLNNYSEAKEVPGIKIFRFEQSLFFVNTEHFRNSLYKRTINPRELKIVQKKRAAKLEKQKKKKHIIVSGGDNCPDVSISDDFADMELEVTRDETRIEMVEKKCPPDVNFHTIILDCSPWSFVDSMGVKVLIAVIMEYKAIGVHLCLASCKGAIREMFMKTSFYETLDHSNIYVTIHDAVLHSMYEESTELVVPTPRNSSITGTRHSSMTGTDISAHFISHDPSNHSTVVTASDNGYKDMQFADEEPNKQKQSEVKKLLSNSKI